MNEIHQNFRDRGLVRPIDGGLLGGVCAGLGRRFGIDPWPARAIFVLALLILPGSQFLVYPLLWVLMPRENAGVVQYGTPTVTSTPSTPPTQAYPQG
jgi:phage shock protein C